METRIFTKNKLPLTLDYILAGAVSLFILWLPLPRYFDKMILYYLFIAVMTARLWGTGKVTLKPNFLAWPAAGFALASIFGLFHAHYSTWGTLDVLLREVIIPLSLFYLIAAGIQGRQLKLVFAGYFMFCAILPLHALAAARNTFDSGRLLFVSWRDPISLSHSMGVYIVMGMGFLGMAKSRVSRLAGLAVIGSAFYVLLLSGTRGAILPVGFTLLACAFVSDKKLFLVLLAIILISPFLLPQNFRKRNLSVFKLETYTKREGANMSGRFGIWRLSFLALREHWLLGVGSGNDNGMKTLTEYEKKYDLEPGSSVINSAHNTYLQEWLTKGLPGILSILWLMLSIVLKMKANSAVFREKKETSYYLAVASMALLCIAGIGVTACIFDAWRESFLNWVVWIVLGIFVAAVNGVEEERAAALNT